MTRIGSVTTCRRSIGRLTAGFAAWKPPLMTHLCWSAICERGRLKIIQEQVGHRYQSTTALYTGISGDVMNTMMRKALEGAFGADEDTG